MYAVSRSPCEQDEESFKAHHQKKNRRPLPLSISLSRPRDRQAFREMFMRDRFVEEVLPETSIDYNSSLTLFAAELMLLAAASTPLLAAA